LLYVDQIWRAHQLNIQVILYMILSAFLLVRKIANSGKIHQIFYAQLKKVEKG